jgi:hypothetical protein
MAQSILRAVLVAGVVTFGASTALAQFGFIFGDPPPRPPGSVPGGGNSGPGGRGSMPSPPRQYPPPPQQTPPDYPPGSGPQTRPGLDIAPPPRGAPPPQRPANAPPPVPPPPDDEVVAPSAQRVVHPTAHFSGLDKITGRIINFPVDVGETVQFGALQLTTRACYTRPPTETANTDAFVEVDEVTLQGEVKRIFTGWMFASSPGLHAVEHPIYDLWLTDCRGGNQVVSNEGAEPPSAQPKAQPKAKAQPPAQPKQKQVQQQPPRQTMPPPPPPQPQQQNTFPLFR